MKPKEQAIRPEVEPAVVELCRRAWRFRLLASMLEEDGHPDGAEQARAELAGVMAEIEALPDPVPAALRARYLSGSVKGENDG